MLPCVTFELNEEYWFWAQDISLWFQTTTLIHGGLGHRPLLCEELVLFGFYRALFAIHVFYGKSLMFGLYLLFLQT